MNTILIETSNCYRVLNNDAKIFARIAVVGLTYNKDVMCRVFSNIVDSDEIYDINKNRRYKIDFNNKKITGNQLEHIRENGDQIQEKLVDILYDKHNITISKDYKQVLDDITNKIKVQIIIYDENKEIKYETGEHDYKIYSIHINGSYHIITDINWFKKSSGDKKITAGCKSVSFDEKHLKSCLKTRLSEEEQLQLYNNMKNLEMTEYGISELISKVSNNVMQKILSTNINNEECRIKEWIFAIACNNCNIGQVYECNDYRSLFKCCNNFNNIHECEKNRSKYLLVNICKKCKSYKFSGIRHECKNNRRRIKVDSNDGMRSIYYNEKDDLSIITDINDKY